MPVELRLVADRSLGRLARWLRLMGYDTAYDVAWSDAQLVRLARAEDRRLLTRSPSLAGRRGVRTLLLRSDDLAEQLHQLQDEIGLRLQAGLGRCPVCNESLEVVPKDWAWGQVPPYVFCTQEAFRLCPRCNRFYWRGTHRTRMQERLAGWRSESPVDDASAGG